MKRIKQHCVYVIRQENTGYCKIGYTCNVKARLATLSTANPHKLHVVTKLDCTDETIARLVERTLHHTYKKWHINLEWYVFSDRQVKELIALLADHKALATLCKQHKEREDNRNEYFRNK